MKEPTIAIIRPKEEAQDRLLDSECLDECLDECPVECLADGLTTCWLGPRPVALLTNDERTVRRLDAPNDRSRVHEEDATSPEQKQE